ncbi:sensor histidine kinase [Paenibacillus sonchi]|uniref:Sensor histidine kinase n=1 Tax=Paenibacillus sonchi TaxID=373687 RepID=A0A974SDJ9_9BACL|nr:sensor histidine kinase [Paenibacillus sonchi]QQZ61316.1 sensor histidine kinase [Paenibacillus sonchi]
MKLKLKHKVTLAFLVFIVLPFIVVGWISAYVAVDTIKEEVGSTTLQLVKQNHTTIDKTISAINDRTITLLDSQFFSNPAGYSFWTGIDTLNEIQQADNILESWSTGSTEYAIYLKNIERRDTPFDLSHKTKGFKYLDKDNSGLPDAMVSGMDLSGGGALRITHSDSGEKTLSFMRSILNPRNYDEAIGLLVVNKVEVLLTRDMVSVELPSTAGVFLFNDNEELLMSAGSGSISPAELHKNIEPEASYGYTFAEEGGEEWLYAYSDSSKFHTRLLYKIPLASITGKQIWVQKMLVFISIIFLAFVLTFVLYLVRLVVKPVVKLVSVMKVYEPGKTLSWSEEPLRNDEFGILHGSFVKMTKRLDYSIEENYVMQLKQKEYELLMLQSQITPHYLYNTLDSIYWYALDSGNAEVGEMVRDLSMLLRIGLSRGRKMITIGEEIEHAKAYTRLQEKRYPDTFEVWWQIDETLRDYETPKVIIQPLIENAIIHGVRGMDGEGELRVSAVKSEDTLRFIVEDNGHLPVNLEELSAIMQGEHSAKGYGIRNVHQRIQLHYGEAFGLTYERSEEGGTRAIITLPLRRPE